VSNLDKKTEEALLHAVVKKKRKDRVQLVLTLQTFTWRLTAA